MCGWSKLGLVKSSLAWIGKRAMTQLTPTSIHPRAPCARPCLVNHPRTRFLDLPRDRRVDPVKDAGHADEDGGLERADVIDEAGGVTLVTCARGWMVGLVATSCSVCFALAAQMRSETNKYG